MLQEAGLMAQIQHEHLLPFVGISLKGGLKIVTLLRIIGPLNRFLEQQKRALSSKNLILYCYQIASVFFLVFNRTFIFPMFRPWNI
jgi:hypothetical protein